jgi:crotonobetainyl-CoA:carnitine CoA-transferase CaiB-like acyl-CoA transferase
VMKMLGLDYKSAMKANPKLIYCSMPCPGKDGSSANLLAFDMLARARGGLMSVPGRMGNRYQDAVPWNSQEAIRLPENIAL